MNAKAGGIKCDMLKDWVWTWGIGYVTFFKSQKILQSACWPFISTRNLTWSMTVPCQKAKFCTCSSHVPIPTLCIFCSLSVGKTLADSTTVWLIITDVPQSATSSLTRSCAALGYVGSMADNRQALEKVTDLKLGFKILQTQGRAHLSDHGRVVLISVRFTRDIAA